MFIGITSGRKKNSYASFRYGRKGLLRRGGEINSVSNRFLALKRSWEPFVLSRLQISAFFCVSVYVCARAAYTSGRASLIYMSKPFDVYSYISTIFNVSIRCIDENKTLNFGTEGDSDCDII